METSNSSGKNFSSGIEPWIEIETGARVWEEFSPKEKEAIVRHFAPKIKIIASRLRLKLPQSVELSELISAGTVGLMESLKKFKSSMGFKFDTYSESRIKGAMLDELRRMDWFSRGMRKIVKTLESATRRYEQETGRQPSVEQLQKLTGLSGKDIAEGLEAMQNQLCLSLEAITDNFASEDKPHLGNEPFHSTAQQDLVDKIARLIDELTDREKLALSLYYVEELTMKETAEAMGVTEGRVSQLHSQALTKLKKKFVAKYGKDAK